MDLAFRSDPAADRLLPLTNGGATIQLKQNRKSTTTMVVKRLQGAFGKIAGAKIQVTPFDVVANIIGGSNLGLTVDVFGNDLTQLAITSADVQAQIEKIPGLTGVIRRYRTPLQRFITRLTVTRPKHLEFSFQDIANTLTASTNGDLSNLLPRGWISVSNHGAGASKPATERFSIEDLPIAGTEKPAEWRRSN